MSNNNTVHSKRPKEDEDDEGPLTWRMDPEKSLSDWTIEIVTKESTGEDDGATATCSKIYHVHRCILAVGNKKGNFFDKLFRSNFSETETKTVRIELEKDAADEFPTLLDYMYSPENKLDVTMENIPAMLALADYLDVKSVHDYISKFCHGNLTMETSATFYNYAVDFQIPSLQSKAIDMCHRNFLRSGSSLLVFHAQVKFWLDLRECFNDNDKIELLYFSQLVANFCSIRTTKLNLDDFRSLTNKQNLPFIDYRAAEILLKVELQVEKVNQNSKMLTDLQERCIEALATAWEKHNFRSEKLSDFSPIVLARLVEEIVDKAKAKVSKVSRSFAVQVQNAGVPAANGIYFLDEGVEDSVLVLYPCFKKEEKPFDECSFYLYMVPESSSWRIVMLPKESQLRSVDEIVLYSATGHDRIPPLSGWTCSAQHGKRPAPSLGFY